ncbi:hypothetical protein AY488_05495 [Corynebacterium belfantii]|nr:hypothetical protein AY473_07440 [Corynebacterium diphtheriae bv. mitis]OWN26217.1 hypothetical protein AY486_01245 [Corynebacterium diphtheriae bv. mitis]OWN41497.1 hypothetical protein AY488_05495 [Corynebacterium belfantii]OWO30218.1 hypothetical protein AY536_00460 [Corynebacterium diphtheriae bv. mitis]
MNKAEKRTQLTLPKHPIGFDQQVYLFPQVAYNCINIYLGVKQINNRYCWQDTKPQHIFLLIHNCPTYKKKRRLEKLGGASTTDRNCGFGRF